MKAMIFNSGIGKRMEALTKNTHKSLVVLNDGETILERQIRLLSECGIKDFIITTGPYEEKLIAICNRYPNLNFKFVHNDLYDKTNYIYSFFLAKDYIDDDFLLLHGDLVFNKKLVTDILNDERKSIGLINKSVPKPLKDFKARIVDGEIKEIGINIFDQNCYAFQPFYKLAKKDITCWIENVVNFIKSNKDNVYAENALNEITNEIHIYVKEYDKYFVEEIDNPEDYIRVCSNIRLYDFDEQEQYTSLDLIEQLDSPLIVVDSFLEEKFKIHKTFSDFVSNPTYENVMAGVKAFSGCKSIVSIGGGSAIDVAKAIKYYVSLDKNGEYCYRNIPHVAVPTTAGTGSESTRYAVIYKDGVKLSLTHDALFPNAAILNEGFIKTLPIYQKKCTLFDALGHSIESIWSINATKQSICYAREAIDIIKKYYKGYLNGDESTIKSIQKAANLAGKAINISQTTAAHALSYKITSLFKIPHGHAVMLTLPFLWKLVEKKMPEKLVYINISYDELLEFIEYSNLNMKLDITEEYLKILTGSVNKERLKNFPVDLSLDDIKQVYQSLIRN